MYMYILCSLTLTYRDNVIPRCQAFYNEDTNTYSIKDDTRRFRKYKDLYVQHICDIDTSTSDLEMIKNKGCQMTVYPISAKKICSYLSNVYVNI